MKTWKIETLVVAGILIAVNLITHHLFSLDALAALAVLLSFGATSISDRLTEQEALRAQPQVECYRKFILYFLGKEICWFLYFFLTHAYSALVGVCIFLLYPLWRKFYRKRFPIHNG